MEWIFLLLLIGAVLFGPPLLIGYAIGHHRGRIRERREWQAREQGRHAAARQSGPDPYKMHPAARPQQNQGDWRGTAGTAHQPGRTAEQPPEPTPQPQRSPEPSAQPLQPGRTPAPAGQDDPVEQPTAAAEPRPAEQIWLPPDQRPKRLPRTEPTVVPSSDSRAPIGRAEPGQHTMNYASGRAAARTQPTRTTPPPRPPRKPRRPRTPADEHRSINISLYVGGLVLTAAALAFVAAVQNPVLTASSLLVAYLLFAGTGLWLAIKVAILKPAGYAIFGTSLALLAVAAIPVNEAFIGNGLITWAAVSMVGLVVYGYASVHLNSSVLGYLVIPFLYSSIFGSTASLQAPLVWTLVGIMVLSTAVQLAVIALGERVPAVLRRPFGQLHWVVVPGVLIAGALLLGQLRSFDYVWLFGAAAAYWAVSAVRPVAVQYRPVYALAARAAATASLLSLLVLYRMEAAGVLAALGVWFAGFFLLTAALPQISGLPRGQKLPVQSLNRREARRLDLAGNLILAVALGLLAQAWVLLPGPVVGAIGYLWLVIGAAAVLLSTGWLLLVMRPRAAASDRSQLDGGLRASWAAGAALALPHHPWFSLLWLALWAVAERRIADPALRGRIHRAQAVAALAVLGWAAGQYNDDLVFGARLALLGLAVGAAATALLLALRRDRMQAAQAEAVIYWLITATGFTAGAELFGLAGIMQPFYAFAAMTVIYTTAVFLLRSMRGSKDGRLEDTFLGIRGLSFLAGAVTAALSIDWDTAWALSSGAADPAPTYALLILLSFAVAELFSAEALRPSRANRALPAQSAAVLRSSELWPGAHVAANGLWAGAINLAVFWTEPVLGSEAVLMWWLTVPAWAAAALTGAVALRRSTRKSDELPARKVHPRVYGALAAVFGLLVLFTGAGSWWAETAVALGLLILAGTAFGPARRLPEAAVLAPAAAGTGVYLLVRALLDSFGPGELGEQPELGLLSAAAVLVCIPLITAVLSRYFQHDAAPAGQAPRPHPRPFLVQTSSAGAVVTAFAAAELLRSRMLRSPGDASAWWEHALPPAIALMSLAALTGLLLRAIPQLASVQEARIGRLLVFVPGAALVALSVDWSQAVHTGGGRAGLLPSIWLLVLAAALLAAELLVARRMRRISGTPPVRRWVPAHLAANGVWLAGLNLAVGLTGAGQLWWAAGLGWAGAALLLTAERWSPRLYGALVLLTAAAALLLPVLTEPEALHWWAGASAGAAALAIAAAARGPASRFREAPATLALASLMGAYVLLRSVLGTVIPAGLGYPLTEQLAAAVAVSAMVALVLSLRDRMLLGCGSAAALAWLFTAAHLLPLPGTSAGAAEPLLQAGLAGIGLTGIYLLLANAANQRTAPPTTEQLSGTQRTAARSAVFAAATALCLLALNWPAAVQAGQPAPRDALHLASAGAALGVAGLLLTAELLGTRVMGRGPAHRWIPLHLATNAFWLALVNMVMLLAGIVGDLWWFTAVPWAAASMIFLRGAARSTTAEAPLPDRDLIPARGYAAAAALMLLVALLGGAAWWAQAAVAAAVLTLGAGMLKWGMRLPEAPFAAVGFLTAGSAAFLLVTAADLLSGTQLWGTSGDHRSVLGYLVGSGVFTVLALAALAARRLWPRGPARRRLTITAGAGAVLASLAPLVTAEQHAAAPMAWSLPAMHLALAAALSRFRGSRPAGALLGPLLIPFSGLFAYSMTAETTSTALSVTLMLSLGGVLAAETWLQLRTGQDQLSTWQQAHWVLGGIITLLLSGLALAGDAAAVQFIALGGAALLLVAGLLRGVKLGVYWGAAVIVVSVLWALRGIMFLFLTAVGALIIGAAIWRLLLVQRKQAADDAAGKQEDQASE